MGNVYIGRLAGLEVVVDRPDNGAEDAVIPRLRNRLVRRPRIWKGLRDNLDGLAAWVRDS